MRLTEFGKVVRTLRMKYDIALKDMAAAMKMGSSYLSALEYGERKLSDDHIARAVEYWKDKATAEELSELRRAAAASTDVVNTAELQPDARHHVAAFARRLQEGQEVPPEMLSWLHSKH